MLKLIQTLFYKGRTRDWYAHYNSLLEKQGEDVTIGCHLLDTKTHEKKPILFKHTEFDGIAAITTGLLEYGYKNDDLPVILTRRQKLTLKHFPRFLAFIRGELLPSKKIPWKNAHKGMELKTWGPFGEHFDLATSQRIMVKAKELNSPYSSLLLKSLSDAVTEYYYDHKDLTRWHIPINLRNDIGSTTKGNEFTNFILEINPEDTASRITRKIKKQFLSGDHLVTLFFLQLGDYRGFEKVLDDKVKKDYKKREISSRVNGSFSSLGSWPNKKAVNLVGDKVVVPFGNVSLMNPICALNMDWHGQITMSLVLHSCICSSENEGKELLALWKRNLLRLLES